MSEKRAFGFARRAPCANFAGKSKNMKITSAEFAVSNSNVEKCPDGTLAEYAFIGRSNVGKSSLINMLTGRKSLAMTSSTPGKTMLINHFLINKEWFLVDLPGYGYAKRSKREVEKLKVLIESYVVRRMQLTCLFVLVDSRIPPQRIDLEFVRFLGEHGVPFCILFTKTDKLKPAKIHANTTAFMDALSEEWEELPPYFITSSQTGAGREEVLGYIDTVNKSLSANA